MPILIEFEPCAPLELKIKTKSLAAEARIIKNLERRLKRRYTRITPIYSTDPEIGLDNLTKDMPRVIVGYDRHGRDVAAIQRLAERYSDQDKRIVAQRFSEWLADATNWIVTSKPTKGGARDQTRP